MIKKILALLVITTLILALASCGKKKEEEKTTESTEEQINETVDNYDDSTLYENAIPITIELENGGIMKGELYPNLAPITVKNFEKLADEHFFDGLIFHRVIKDFMIQGGGYDKNMNPKETDSIKGEFSSNGVRNPLKHTKGVLSMARTQDPNSASSQFFIMHADAPHLDGEYAAFGKITEGLDVIDEIANCETGTYEPYGMTDYPTEPIIIKTITVNK